MRSFILSYFALTFYPQSFFVPWALVKHVSSFLPSWLLSPSLSFYIQLISCWLNLSLCEALTFKETSFPLRSLSRSLSPSTITFSSLLLLFNFLDSRVWFWFRQVQGDPFLPRKESHRLSSPKNPACSLQPPVSQSHRAEHIDSVLPCLAGG